MDGGQVYQNSGLQRFGSPQQFSYGQYTPPTFRAPSLPPLRQAPGSPAAGGGSSSGLLGGGGEGGAMGPPDPSTNPSMSNSITTGILGLMMGPAVAMAAQGLLGGSGSAGVPGGVSSAAATIGDSGVPSGAVAGEGLGAIGPSGDDGGGGGGSGGGGK